MNTWMTRPLVHVAFACLLVGAAASAQPRAELRQIMPTGTLTTFLLHTHVSCGGAPVYDLHASDIRITENGRMIDARDIHIDRAPSRDDNACFELVMIVDNSSVLPGAALPVLPVAGMRLVDSLPLPCQRVGVITYSSSPRLREFITSDRARIRTALGDVNASGGSAMHDAVRAALTELRLNLGANDQYVLLAATGRDNASIASREDLLQELQPNAMDRIPQRLLTVPIGPDADTVALRALADGGGGIALAPRALDALPDLYDSLAHQLRRRLDEYVIRYVSPDATAWTRIVTIEIAACGDTAAATRRFPRFSQVTEAERVLPPHRAAITDVFPQPAEDVLTVRAQSGTPGSVRIVLRDVLGRVAAVLQDGWMEGTTELRADVRDLAAGLYTLELVTPHATVRKRVVVARGTFR